MASLSSGYLRLFYWIIDWFEHHNDRSSTVALGWSDFPGCGETLYVTAAIQR